MTDPSHKQSSRAHSSAVQHPAQAICVRALVRRSATAQHRARNRQSAPPMPVVTGAAANDANSAQSNRGRKDHKRRRPKGRSQRSKRAKACAPWDQLPDDVLRIILFSVATDDPCGLVEDDEPADERPLRPQPFRAHLQISESLPVSVAGQPRDQHGPRSQGVRRGIRVLLAPWRLHFRLACKTFHRAASALSSLSIRRWVARSLAEDILWRTSRVDTGREEQLATCAPLPDAKRIARTLDRAMVATGAQTSRAIRRVVLRRRDARGNAVHGPSFGADWLLRYVVGSPESSLPPPFAPSNDSQPPVPVYSHCDGDQAMALIGVVNIYAQSQFQSKSRASRLIDFAATRNETSAVSKHAIADGILRFIFCETTIDLVRGLETPFETEGHRIDRFTGWPSEDGRAPFSFKAAYTAVRYNPYLFACLPSINRNDVRLWKRACCVHPLMITRVSRMAIIGIYRQPQARKVLIDVMIRAILEPRYGSKTLPARFMSAVPDRVRKDASFVADMLRSAPRRTLDRVRLLQLLPAVIRKRVDIQRIVFGSNFERGFLDTSGSTPIYVMREHKDESWQGDGEQGSAAGASGGAGSIA